MSSRKLLLGILIATAMLWYLPACGKGDDGSGGGGTVVTRDMLVADWVVSHIGKSECAGCLILKLNADGTGSLTDPNGYFFGEPTTEQGGWDYAGGILYLTYTTYSMQAKVEMPTHNQLKLAIGKSRLTLVRGG